jgi:hypothetical protein
MTMQYRNIDRPGAPQTVTVEFLRGETPETDADLSWLQQDYADVADAGEREKYLAQDAARRQGYNNGDWYTRGLFVIARISVPIGGNSFAMYELRSPGLWGVESDCGTEYENEVWTDEENSLRRALKAMAPVFAALEVQS